MVKNQMDQIPGLLIKNGKKKDRIPVPEKCWPALGFVLKEPDNQKDQNSN